MNTLLSHRITPWIVAVFLHAAVLAFPVEPPEIQQETIEIELFQEIEPVDKVSEDPIPPVPVETPRPTPDIPTPPIEQAPPPEPDPEPITEPKPQPKPEPVTDPDPEPKPEPKPEPEPAPEREPEPVREPVLEPKPQPQPIPKRPTPAPVEHRPVPPPSPQPTPRPPAPQPPVVVQPRTPSPVAAPKPAPSQPPAVAEKPVPAPAPPSKPVVQTVTQNEWDQYISSIRRRLADGKRYPGVARRAGLEGTVRISFNISNSGEVSDIRIEDSSGHAILDKATTSLVLRVSPFPPPPGGSKRYEFSLRYELN